jgi:ribosomal protein L29
MTNKDKSKLDYKSLSMNKLESLCKEGKKELCELRFRKLSKNLADTSLIAKKTKQIARIKTEMSMKLKQEVLGA